MTTESTLERIATKFGHIQDVYRNLSWIGTFDDYFEIIRRQPAVLRTAFQRVYDMIMSYGTGTQKLGGKKIVTTYGFFDDPDNNGRDAIFGLAEPLANLVNVLKGAAQCHGPEKRVLLLHGPVGSSKSTIVRLLKRGLERYSRTDAGALYTFDWRAEAVNPRCQESEKGTWVVCPMHEEPLLLLPPEVRVSDDTLLELGLPKNRLWQVKEYLGERELCPFCRNVYMDSMRRHDGDWAKVIREDTRIRRLLLSEQDRVGIGTFQPKDEKNQDSTELTGDINYRKIAEYGSESDPRAFNFDGEFNIANRGIVEFIEVLKLDVAFLYDLLGASQEHKVKPKKFAQTDIDEVIIGHTNEPEYRKLQSNEFMEALRDRTIKVDIPYVTTLADEIRVYQKDYGLNRSLGRHIAPHTLEIAAMWVVLTRLEDPKKANLTRIQKLKLYNGKTLPGFTEDHIQELRDETTREGMIGISARYAQDKIANALTLEHLLDTGQRADINPEGIQCVNPFMVLNELETGLKHHSLIQKEDDRKAFAQLLVVAKEEYEDIVKNEVQRAIAADEEALQRLCGNYLDNVKAYTLKEKVVNKYTGQKEEPDERLMRSIEQKIDIPEARKDDFRREIMNYIGALAIDHKQFDFKSSERLLKALELKLFEDQKDTIKLTSLVSHTVDQATQEKIDVVKQRLKDKYGYCEVCATDVLNYVASIFARGDVKKETK